MKRETVKKESLTDNQEKYVRSNHRRMSVKEMATNVSVPVSRIYAFMYANQIEVRVVRIKQLSVATKTTHVPRGYFNVNAKTNWII